MHHNISLEDIFHFHLLRDLDHLIERDAAPAELEPLVEPLLVELAIAIQEFPYPSLVKAFVKAVRAVPTLRPDAQSQADW